MLAISAILYDDIIRLIADYLDLESKIHWFSTCKRFRELLLRSIKIQTRVDWGSLPETPLRGIFMNLNIRSDENLRRYMYFQKYVLGQVDHVVDTIRLGPSFTRPINLPPARNLIMWPTLDVPITLPRELLSVDFGLSFNHPVDLPPQVQEVHFGYYFNQRVTLPDSVQTLSIPKNYNYPLMWPKSLKSLFISGQYPYTLPGAHVKIIYFTKFFVYINLNIWNHNIIIRTSWRFLCSTYRAIYSSKLLPD